MSSLIQKLKKNKSVQKTMGVNVRPEFISTGCYSLNILFSGRLKGGIPIGRISMMAAPSASAKSTVGLKVARNAQKHHGMDVLYVDTEFAYDPSFCQAVGVDMDKFLPIQSNRIEEVQQAVASSISDLDPEERKNLLVVVDSWGGLVTSKTMNDAVEGKDVADMTIAKKKNSLARVLSGLGVTVFVTNHTYACGSEQVKTLTPDRGPISLKELNVGDLVSTMGGIEPVVSTFTYDNTPVYKIEMENGEFFEFTEGHKLLIHTEQGQHWKPVSEIIPGDNIVEMEI